MLWARANRFPFAAMEVSLPGGRFRLDAAAAKPGRERVRYFCERNQCHRIRSATTAGPAVIFECKAARSDLLKDSMDFRTTLDRLAILAERRVLHESWLAARAPHLCVREGLFEEFHRLQPKASHEYESLRLVLAEIDKLQRRLFGRTKFSRLRAMRFADLHYLVTPPDLLEPYELPKGWGWLVPNGNILIERVAAEAVRPPDEGRIILLQRIALAGTRQIFAASGLPAWGETDYQDARGF